MKFSELIGKDVICLSFAKNLGNIFNCTVDKKLKKINQFVTVDNDENDAYIQSRFINFGLDTLFTTYNLADYEANGIKFPFRKNVYTTDGKFEGVVGDFEFENGKITKLFVSDKIINPVDVALVSDEMIIVKGNRRIRLKNVNKEIVNVDDSFNADYNAADKNEPLATNTMENTLNAGDFGGDFNRQKSNASASVNLNYIPLNSVRFEPNIDKSQQAKQDEIFNTESPRKLISGYKFLLGRKVIKSILSGGKLIIPQGQIIDDHTVELARKFGKLVELTVSSR